MMNYRYLDPLRLFLKQINKNKKVLSGSAQLTKENILKKSLVNILEEKRY